MSSPLTRQVGAAARMLLALTLLLGVLYPAAIWGIGRLGLSSQADGSRVQRAGVVVGSSLLGQNFTDERHFQSRPSASSYAGDVSGGTNLYASSDEQRKALAERSRGYANAHGGVQGPADALTASASGLDPHISPSNALAQAPRVAAANGLDEGIVVELVHQHTQGRTLGFLGEPRVNVLELNLALDRRAGR
ncbi:K+-transporting ATPase ATPase C chain [Pedococcus cremeus]|uniref:Potassium-transporting ATPase KdpC subunit n=1 Tax=Pedococcus cremeus TaxID=587636 RepID=A0A1H9XIV2_9MICO|nr:K(+)-transporting ATPase subunit C [Pedococcus cremeus]SES46126.1 K+-transporting ATPase ATPase C chain [Pedococcus cremeus]